MSRETSNDSQRGAPGRSRLANTSGGAAAVRDGTAPAGAVKLDGYRVRTAYEQVAEHLRALIVSGALAPGDRLPPETELGPLFGVSRNTIREALRTLGSLGLTEVRRGAAGGTFVVPADPRTVTEFLEGAIGRLRGTAELSNAELLEARELLEVPIARLAALRRDDAGLVALRAAIERERCERTRVQVLGHHETFHGTLIDVAGNRLLAAFAEPIFRVVRARISHVLRNKLADEGPDHEAILDRVAAGDAEGAAEAMHEHLVHLHWRLCEAEPRQVGPGARYPATGASADS